MADKKTPYLLLETVTSALEKIRKSMELGIPKDFAIMTGASSKSYWHLSKCYAPNAAISKEWQVV